MYSGTTFRTKSGRVMGVHQRIDRVARKLISRHIPKTMQFPTSREIVHFEGLNGPDGIKRKSPARDELWHYIDPTDPSDRVIVDIIEEHIHNMAVALSSGNTVRASFEAAWMAHAVVDGLTPAHHYPLEAKLEELRGGEGLETRVSTKDKLVMPGTNRRHQIRNNWEYWGAKGVMTTHFGFEVGVASTIATVRFDDLQLTNEEITRTKHDGFATVYLDAVHRVAELGMYKEFSRLGWTRQLARETKDTLMPEIVKMVALGWYSAIEQSEQSS